MIDDIKTIDNWQEEALINQTDFMEEVVRSALQKVINTEFENFIQAGHYERTDGRQGYRNGSYDRTLHTRVGSIQLRICRDRDGNFKTDLFDRYQRSEKAMLLALSEMYIQGVSTRKVSSIVEQLCGHSISKSQVSNLSHELDKDLETWRERPLAEDYSYLIFDARYEKIREGGRVISKAVVVVIGINNLGVREILGCSVINSESFTAWDDFIERLKQRGLKGVIYAVTDDNKGLRKALGKHFQGVILQRCQVHFLRNFLSKLGKSDQQEAKQLLQEVFAAHSKESAFHSVGLLISWLQNKRKEKVAQWIEENIEESLQVLALPAEHRKKMKSTNLIERLNQELKRRSRVVRIFPNVDSCLRLISALCQETSEAWGHRKYITMEV
jgi:putative transposase